MIKKLVTWSELKDFFIDRGLFLQYIEDSNIYHLYASDSYLTLEHMMDKNPSDSTDLDDFEDNYKAAANTAISQIDTDGAHIVRLKAAKKGWTYSVVPIEFETSRRSNLLYSKLADNTNRSGITLKVYDANDVEVTTDGLLNANWATITKTVIDFEPTYDYEVIGGYIRTLNDITMDIRIWIVAVPDIDAGSGGSKEMIGGLNLNYMKPENVFNVDGRVSKSLKYDATYHTNKLRMILRYPAGTHEFICINLEHYKA